MQESNLRANAARWLSYQRERFPLLAHGLLIASFSTSAIAFSALLRGQHHFASFWLLLAGFCSSLTIFLQLRIADEFKDFDEDRTFRPYRPVPRGLVQLRELRVIAVGCAVLQAVIAVAVDVRLLLPLVLVWIYLGLMTAEFFVPGWLKARPVLYMLSHMAIMPVIDLYISAFDWVPAHAGPPSGLLWFLFVSFCNGIVVEIGRKIRAPHDEEHGVETYSALWGSTVAVLAWFSAILLTASFALGAAGAIDRTTQEMIVLGIVVAFAAATGVWFMRKPSSKAARLIEILSGVWTLIVYLGLGTVPMLARALQ